MSSRIYKLIKTVTGLFIVAYVIKNNLIDLKKVSEVMVNPINFIIGIGLVSLTTICMSYRFYLFVKPMNNSVTLLGLFENSMIGQFFGTFLPGSIGGDVVRAWYLSREGVQSGKAVSQIIVWDRAIGLTVTCVAAALVSSVPEIPGLQKETVYNIQTASWLVSGCLVLTGVFFYYIAPRLKFSFLSKPKIFLFWDFFIGYRPSFKTLIVGAFYSLLSVLLTITFGFAIGQSIGLKLPLTIYAFIVPIGTLISAVPLLPLGIGLGQVAFSNLFYWVGNTNNQDGATVCTLMQCYRILFSLLGIISYFRLNSKQKQESTTASTLPSDQVKKTG